VGVPRPVFEQWLERGTRKSRPSSRYRRFAENVRTALAVCRIRAEIVMVQKDPRTWLLCGPGKDRLDYAGWSSAIKGEPREDQTEINLLADPALARIMEAVLAALTPFPEARQAVAAAIQRPGREKKTAPETPDEQEFDSE
jgi:hypothetical protein